MTILCAFCAERAASTVDKIDGRIYRACSECVDGTVPDPPASRTWAARLYRLLRMSPGMQVDEIHLAMGATSDVEKGAISKALSRLCASGKCCFVGAKNDRFYYPGRSTVDG